MWGKGANPVSPAAPWTDRLLPLQEGQCPPDIVVIVIERMRVIVVFKILTSICMAMAGEGEEGIVAPLLPLALGSEEL